MARLPEKSASTLVSSFAAASKAPAAAKNAPRAPTRRKAERCSRGWFLLFSWFFRHKNQEVPRLSTENGGFKPFLVTCAQKMRQCKKPAKPFQNWLRGLLHAWWSTSGQALRFRATQIMSWRCFMLKLCVGVADPKRERALLMAAHKEDGHTSLEICESSFFGSESQRPISCCHTQKD